MDYELIYRRTGFDFMGDQASYRGGLSKHKKKFCDGLDEDKDIKIGCNEYKRSHLYALIDPIAFCIDYQDYLDYLHKGGEITESELNAELNITGDGRDKTKEQRW